jgi:hypothetical protein
LENVEMTESEARKVFEQKLSLCDVLGLDLKGECLAAGVPADMFDRLVQADRRLARAMTACISDPSLMPSRRATRAAIAGGEAQEMSVGFTCLGQSCTGLPMIVWAMVRRDSRKVPYVRVQSNHDLVPEIRTAIDLTLDHRPKLLPGSAMSEPDLASTREFVRRNRRVLLDYWTGTLDSRQLIDGLAPR